MAGGFKIKRRRKNKYKKLNLEGDSLVQKEGKESRTQTECKSSQLELSAQAEQGTGCQGKKKKETRKKVHLCPLPDRYEPLEEGVEEPAESKEDKKYKKKQKAKKYAKNVGKAVRSGCRYLLIGIQSLANAYSSPFFVSSVVLSSMQR
ncbi:required for drug-induced death protein 1 [Rhinophrynus dorsalis]